jgi:prephenate dehydrogenase
MIGGSVARRLAPEHDVRVWDADAATRDAARAAGLCVREEVADTDIVVVATPLDAMPTVLSGLSTRDEQPHHEQPDGGPTDGGPTVTDVGSVKAPVLAAARAAGLAGRYVGGHPMAGVEGSGFAASEPALLAGAVWVLTLEQDTDLDRWLAVAELVTGAGARVLPTTAAAHDEAQARISGLPHLLATALALAGGRGGPLAAALAAGSFRDGTRVAGSRPELVAALCDGNRAALATVLDEALAELSAARDALVTGGSVLPLAVAGHAARRRWAEPAPAVGVTLERDSATLRRDLLALGATGGSLDTVTARRLHGRRPDASSGPEAGRPGL